MVIIRLSYIKKNNRIRNSCGGLVTIVNTVVLVVLILRNGRR